MAARLFIDGAAGTTGLEIRERLKERDEFELLLLDDSRRKDEAARKDALHAADIAILCLPDAAARDAVKLARGSGARIIDASSAHRVAAGWTYGFPELTGHERIADARSVAVPGCYPTGFLALLAPLVRAGLLPSEWPYTVNAVSGYSGGGRALIERFENEPGIAFKAYGLGLEHKHLGEMQKYAGLTHTPVFSPGVAAAHRGMIVDVPLPLAAMGVGAIAARAHAVLSDFYSGQHMVAVHDFGDRPGEMLLRQNCRPWDGVELFVLASEDGAQARLIARLDNLGKGASGAAIQNLNIMCGLPETVWLRLD